MQRRHRARQDSSPETVAHHQVIPFAQFRRRIRPVARNRSCHRHRPSGQTARAPRRSRLAARCRTRASPRARPARQSRRAICCDPSVLPLSATITSPRMPCRSRASSAFLTQMPTVAVSFKQGMTTESSTSPRPSAIREPTCVSVTEPMESKASPFLRRVWPEPERRKQQFRPQNSSHSAAAHSSPKRCHLELYLIPYVAKRF